jgi:hypothetical protein
VALRATVREHLNTIEDAPDWVVSLGEMIQQLDNCSSAIAAARAKDLGRLGEIGRALEEIMHGWQVLRGVDFNKLTPMQRESIQLVIHNILTALKTNFDPNNKEGR